MKKIISIFTFLLTLFSFIIIYSVFSLKEYDNLMRIGETQNSFNIYVHQSDISPQDELAFFEYLNHKYDASIILTSTSNDGTIRKSAIVNSQTFPTTTFRLKNVHFTNKKSFYASYQTKSKNQRGTIPTFSPNNKIKLQSLAAYFNAHRQNIDGVYTILVNKDSELIKKELSRFYQVSEKNLLTPNKNFVVDYLNFNNLIFLVILVILVLIFFMVVLYLPISKISSIGIKKLNGWSNLASLFSLINPGIFTTIITSFCLIIGSFLFINYLPNGFILTCLLTHLFILVIYLLANSFSYFIIRKYTISDLLRGRFHLDFALTCIYILKVLMVAATTLFLVMISASLSTLIKENETQRIWEKEGNLLTIHSVGTIFLQNENEANQRMLNFYQQLDSKKQVYYINSEIIASHELIKNNIPAKYSQLEIMTINQTFAKKAFPFIKDYQVDYYIPLSLKSNILEKLLQKIKYQGLTFKEQEQTSPQKIKLKIRYYSNQIEPITYNPTTKKTFKNPIIELLQPHLSDFQISTLSNTGKRSPLKLQNTKSLISQLNKLKNLPQYKELDLKFTTLNSLLAENTSHIATQLKLLCLVLVLVVCLNIITTLFLISCVIANRKKELAIKRLLGYKTRDCYKYEFLFFGLLGLVAGITLIINQVNWLIIILSLFLLLIDYLALYLLIRRIEKKKLTSLLKGGQL
ncbi:DUF1430 domain-containing protein [Lactobacillus mulieris]|uniref:DUF1430 domain-containing protein n=1 Tax=Lactobacillus mulieris TaxID=2508708 RepID=A0AAW5X052_9LACO|nr:DUF1430 domain-containing protein [Lactobacillus mulieris]MCZ3622751.1 DUF1430 domain-containing protein [Lactobacillus mulieris]MCZ3624446.1 DUF1430 domain-containing protein [Lactobacillus mulieris]MCZ3636771.1 DUF1430 domain-containing protein [Lactobacillus mulieris]MCZ3690618.1 DUF1430 domain-containing protein [Lactobacillus mulieris]MCZ3696551.1 DUF1430 domain-containing protein [Lactobacillus mulieris]